ncbi:phosphopantetheine-binding protein [Actinokineospora sp. PR83]|uniref:phosphopantetheine-binding protein n=1 Tax=Actinokineospora sp. PR83 TaxID=2884908 RepID=UPI001F4399A2|nr:phosphopantetheine-binding protein [Actinokineospora sp. PR83]MCG8914454.1 phosphopantetheine-binding protein [Actinokineospora sp. PR83]
MPDAPADTRVRPDRFVAELVGFVRAEFVPEDEHDQLTSTTPLIESGILDSLRVAVLLTYIRDALGVAVPLALMDARNFRDVESIAAVLRSVEEDR